VTGEMATAAADLMKIADDLAVQSWAVCPQFLDAETCKQLVTEIGALKTAKQMRPAGVGREQNYRLVSNVRSDVLYWLDEQQLSPAAQAAWARLTALKHALNRQLYLGLRDLEAHLTSYAPNGHYQKHVDNFQGQSARILSCIVYLNPAWSATDGGELCLYNPSQPDELIAKILPEAGTLACFLSRDIPHEVLTTSRERFSLTGWFR